MPGPKEDKGEPRKRDHSSLALSDTLPLMSSISLLGIFIFCNLVVAGAVCISPPNALNQDAVAEYLQCIRKEDECTDYDPQVLMGINLCVEGHDCTLDTNKAGCSICSFVPAGLMFIRDVCPKTCLRCGNASSNASLNTSSPGTDLSATSTPPPQLAEKQDCGDLNGSVGALHTSKDSTGLIICSVLVFVLITTGSGIMRMRKKSLRTIATFAATSLCVLFLAVGQTLHNFDISYKLLGVDNTAFKAGFWEGISRLWDNDNKILSLVMCLFSGIWPIIKQAVTFFAVVGWWRPRTELWVLKFLGLSGKLAFMDIGIVVAILATMPIDVDNPELGANGHLAASLREGTFVIVLGLILSRIITSTLIHVSPPEKVSIKRFSASTARFVRPGCLLISVAALCMVIAGAALPAITVTQRMEITPVPGQPSIVITHQEAQYTLWTLVDRCRTQRTSTPAMTTITVVATLLFANILGVLHSFTQMVLMFLGPALRQRSAGTRELVAHSINVMSEWASLDVLAFAVLIAQKELPGMAEAFSRNIASCNGVNLETSIATETGLWLSLFGSLLTFASSPLIIKDCCSLEDDAAAAEVPGQNENDVVENGKDVVPVENDVVENGKNQL